MTALSVRGHVSVLIGSNAYRFIAEDYKKPAVISGFEPIDILLSIYMLVKQIEAKDARIEIEYKRAVTPEGNKKAMGIMWDVFEPADAEWRGIGVIPESGLKLTKNIRHLMQWNILESALKRWRTRQAAIAGMCFAA